MSSAAPNRTDSLTAQLRDSILGGTWRPGERLPAERELASRHAVNRASVREALKKLEQLGLVEIRRGGGARVCHVHEASVDIISHLLHAGGRLDPALALQILDVNELMLAGGARLAMERASESELLEARDLLGRLEAAGDSVDARLAAVDDLFELITRASDNLVLRLIYNAIRPAITGELGRILCTAMLGHGEEQRERLQAIDAAILARDPVAAEEAVRQLQRGERRHLFEALSRGKDRRGMREPAAAGASRSDDPGTEPPAPPADAAPDEGGARP